MELVGMLLAADPLVLAASASKTQPAAVDSRSADSNDRGNV
jgi:hypothetical protein